MATAAPLSRICIGFLTEQDTFDLLNRYSDTRQDLDGSTRKNPFFGPVRDGQFFEVSGDHYHEMLNVLPPLEMGHGGFVMSEFITTTLTNAYFEVRGRCYCVTVDWQGRGTLAAYADALALHLRKERA